MITVVCKIRSRFFGLYATAHWDGAWRNVSTTANHGQLCKFAHCARRSRVVTISEALAREEKMSGDQDTHQVSEGKRGDRFKERPHVM